ncbi:MAG: phosphate/phosphite/phosphonate ABC transporter substrate-binding protein, partial [Myxococcales bacterium]|nr:phosphate/phosphite/phosphonate ABC transporter substrate-binding protein [Myxococcales bacterium]
RQIGEGGMGAVYEAMHTGLGTKIAIKILSEQLAENPTFVRRFRREARAAAAVQHENVVAVTDTGEDDNGVPFIIMELLEGETLAATLRRERVLIPQVAAEVTVQMLRGLGAAHESGVIHRDLKPGNIFLARQADGTYRVKVLDFGISKFAADVSNLNVTVEGTIVGTPNFMAPEQVMGKHDVDGRADLYAVGVMMYRMLTGKLPYAGTSSKEVYDKIIQGNPLKPHQIRPDIPAALENAVVKAMARKAADRFQTADEFVEALRAAVPSLETGTSRPSLPHIPSSDFDSEGIFPNDEPASKTSLPTRSDRPKSTQDSLRRVTTPLAPAYVPEIEPKSSAVPTERGSSRRQAIQSGLVGLGALAFAGVGYAIWRHGQEQGEGGGSLPVTGGVGALKYVVRLYSAAADVRSTHEPVAKYLESKLGRPVELTLIKDYVDVGEVLAGGVNAIGAIPAYTYVLDKDKDPSLELLASAVMQTGATYAGAIVTRKDSKIESLADLKGRSFCFVSESSASGYVYPKVLLLRAGIDPDRDFGSVRMSGDHLESLRALNGGGCDAAAMYEGLTYEVASHGMDPVFKILARTDPIPYDAYCVRGSVDPRFREAIRDALVSLVPNAPETADVLGKTNQLRGFVPAKDADYESVRAMLRFLELAEKKRRR